MMESWRSLAIGIYFARNAEISIFNDNFLVKKFSRTFVCHELFYAANLSTENKN
jgi:hypothetical protein